MADRYAVARGFRMMDAMVGKRVAGDRRALSVGVRGVLAVAWLGVVATAYLTADNRAHHLRAIAGLAEGRALPPGLLALLVSVAASAGAYGAASALRVKQLSVWAFATWAFLLVAVTGRCMASTAPASFGSELVTGAFELRALAVLLYLAALLWLAAALGRRLLSRCRFEGVLPELVCSVGAGLGAASLLLFLLALAGALTSAWTLALVALVVALCRRELLHWAGRLRSSRFPVPDAVSALLLTLVVVVVALDFVAAFKPCPTGFDDLGEYLNVPRLLAAKGGLVSGFNAYAWGLLASLGFVFFDSALLAIMTTFAGGLLVLAGLWLVARRVFSRDELGNRCLLAVGLVYLSLPAVWFQLTQDLKVDLPATFFALVAFYWFLRWRDEGTREALAMWGLMSGVAFVTKYTSVMLVVALLVLTGAEAVARRRGLVATARALLGFAAAAALPFLFFAAWNVAEDPSWLRSGLAAPDPAARARFVVSLLQRGRSSSPELRGDRAVGIDRSDAAEAPITIVATAFQEDVGKYMGYELSPRAVARLPWDVTMGRFVAGWHNDVGFLFLGLIGAFLLFGRFRQRRFVELLLLTVVTTAVWAVLGRGLVWYGFAGLVAPLLMVGAVLARGSRSLVPQPALVHRACVAAVAVWVAMSVVERALAAPNPAFAAYLKGTLSADGARQAFLRNVGYQEAVQLLNREIRATPAAPPTVYRVGGFFPYFVERNDELLYSDNFLDVFNSHVFRERDPALATRRLEGNGFDYLVVAKLSRVEDTSPGRTLAAKYELLRSYVGAVEGRDWVKVVDSNSILVFKARWAGRGERATQ